MNLIRAITCYVPHSGLVAEPQAHRVQIQLLSDRDGKAFIVTPWACFNSNRDVTDAQMAAALCDSFANADEALAHANRGRSWYRLSLSKHKATRRLLVGTDSYDGDSV